MSHLGSLICGWTRAGVAVPRERENLSSIWILSSPLKCAGEMGFYLELWSAVLVRSRRGGTKHRCQRKQLAVWPTCLGKLNSGIPCSLTEVSFLSLVLCAWPVEHYENVTKEKAKFKAWHDWALAASSQLTKGPMLNNCIFLAFHGIYKKVRDGVKELSVCTPTSPKGTITCTVSEGFQNSGAGCGQGHTFWKHFSGTRYAHTIESDPFNPTVPWVFSAKYRKGHHIKMESISIKRIKGFVPPSHTEFSYFKMFVIVILKRIQ